MGRLKRGITGPFSGRVGDIIGGHWNGIPYVRSRPRKRQTPPTENELKTRYIFAMTQRWLTPIKDYLRVGFKDYSRKVFGIAAAKSMLYQKGLIRDGYDSTVDPTQVLISFGHLPITQGFALELDRENSAICIRWNPHIPRERNRLCVRSFDDQIMAVAYDVERGEAHGVIYGALRENGMQLILLPPDLPGKYHVYVAFVTADRKHQSPSTYLGAVEI